MLAHFPRQEKECRERRRLSTVFLNKRIFLLPRADYRVFESKWACGAETPTAEKGEDA